MKTKVTAIVLAGILILSMIGSAACFAETYPTPAQTEDPAAASGAFVDVAEGSFYSDAVNWAVEQGITNGLTETTFGPTQLCNRAQVVTFLWRMDGEPAPASRDERFTDVDWTSWYADAVLWAVEQGITDGMGNGLFQPEGTCNRAQIVTFLWRYAGKPAAADSAENPFTDVKEGDWFADAVLWAVEQGITNGLTTTTFGPGEPCNRAQVVTFLYRYNSELENEPDVTEPTEPQPTEPEPTEPEPTEPEPTEPKPTEPEPTEPKPTEPEPTEPKPTEPKPTEPEPTEPEPTEPEPTEPEPTEPEPTEPEPTEPEPTEPEPTETEPTEPTGPDWGMGGEDI